MPWCLQNALKALIISSHHPSSGNFFTFTVMSARACCGSESMIWDSNLVAIFLERPREKVDSNLFLNDSIQDWFANLLLNKKLRIFDSRIINDSQIFLDSRINVDSNQDSNQILNWFTTHESEIFDSRQALMSAVITINFEGRGMCQLKSIRRAYISTFSLIEESIIVRVLQHTLKNVSRYRYDTFRKKVSRYKIHLQMYLDTRYFWIFILFFKKIKSILILKNDWKIEHKQMETNFYWFLENNQIIMICKHSNN